MPFLSKHFVSEYDFSSVSPVTCTSRRNRTSETQSSIGNFYHRPTLSTMFYDHLKDTLQHTTLDNITYYDEDLSIKIFDINLKFACAQNSGNASSYHCMPIAFEQFMGTQQALTNPAFLTNNISYKTIVETDSANTKSISYGIKVYYNNNFVICHYESYLGFEFPIFCVIQGDAINSSKKVVYVGCCVNVFGNHNSYDTFYHNLVIPDESLEYDSVFPNVSNAYLYTQILFDSSQAHYIFDANIYPNKTILNKLYDTQTQSQSVYMKKLTSWNGLVQYNNVYDVNARIESSTDDISKIQTNSVYTINGNQYYCPGMAITYTSPSGSSQAINAHNNRKPLYLFKL